MSALRHFAATYLGARRAAGELRTKLLAIERERKLWLDAAEKGQLVGQPKAQLDELERVKGTIARSSAAMTEQLRALESVLAAVAADVVATGGVAPEPTGPVAAGSLRSVSSTIGVGAIRPDASVRGSWSPPPGR